MARLRVHGEPIGDPRWVAGAPFDLAAMEHGARVTDASNRFYAAPDNVLMPGPARVMGEGWETARRRDTHNDWLEVALATEGTVQRLELDTSCFIGNAPGWARVTGHTGDGDRVELLAKTPLRKDTVHRFLLDVTVAVDTLRLDIYPDGGLARFRAHGWPTRQGRARLFARWFDSLTEAAALDQLTSYAGASQEWAAALAAKRPLVDSAGVWLHSPLQTPRHQTAGRHRTWCVISPERSRRASGGAADRVTDRAGHSKHHTGDDGRRRIRGLDQSR